MAKKYQDQSAEAVHETMTGLFKLGLITEKRMKEYDEMCLVQEDKAPAKKVHKLNGRAKIAKQGMLKKAS